jgi:hypothetical protein
MNMSMKSKAGLLLAALIVVVAAIYGALTLYMKDTSNFPTWLNVLAAEHGSYAFSGGWGQDRSAMRPYEEGACDWSLNGRAGVSVAHNSTRQQTWVVRDADGYGGRCTVGGMPFRGKYHYACEAWPPVNCGPWSTH